MGDRVRSWLVTGLTPVYWLGALPERTAQWASEISTSRDELHSRNEVLEDRLLVLERRAQKYASLSAENNRLRELLNASAALDDQVMLAEIIALTPDPMTHEVIIDRGTRDGVRMGQAILDADGLMGQVVHASRFTARVVLISDNSHAIPVEVVRSGVRAIAIGTGEPNLLELAHVPDTADIEVGDSLVSSGLGGRFPQGYPVAQVYAVEHDPGEPFARVRARPKAALDRSRRVLVVFTEEAMGSLDDDELEEVN